MLGCMQILLKHPSEVLLGSTGSGKIICCHSWTCLRVQKCWSNAQKPGVSPVKAVSRFSELTRQRGYICAASTESAFVNTQSLPSRSQASFVAPDRRELEDAWENWAWDPTRDRAGDETLDTWLEEPGFCIHFWTSDMQSRKMVSIQAGFSLTWLTRSWSRSMSQTCTQAQKTARTLFISSPSESASESCARRFRRSSVGKLKCSSEGGEQFPAEDMRVAAPWEISSISMGTDMATFETSSDADEREVGR